VQGFLYHMPAGFDPDGFLTSAVLEAVHSLPTAVVLVSDVFN
jgi:hypothetical protein